MLKFHDHQAEAGTVKIVLAGNAAAEVAAEVAEVVAAGFAAGFAAA